MDTLYFLMTGIAGILNLCLLPFVIYKSKYAVGSFKLMMIAFAIWNQLAFFWGDFARPSFFSDDYTIIIYSQGYVNEFGPTMSLIATIISFDTLPTLLLNELYQFIYRYISLCKYNWRRVLKTKYVLTIVIVGPALSFLLFSTVCYFFLFPANEIWRHINNNTRKYLKTEASNLVGPSVMYMTVESDGSHSIRWANCLGVFLFIVFNSITAASGILLACRIHHSLNQNLISEHSKHVHTTVFHMLIAQSIIPLLFHLPALALFFSPLFFASYNGLDFITYVIMMAPLLEPLIAIYFLNAGMFKRWFRLCLRRKQTTKLAPLVINSNSFSDRR